MSRLGFYVLCGTLCSLVVLGQGDGVTLNPDIIIPLNTSTLVPLTTPTTTPVPDPTSPPTPPTTTPPTTTPPTTTPPTTTPPTTTPPTTTPPTTTPPTTTPPTTTPPTTTTTTTPVPPPKPTPTPKPTPPGPLPAPSVGNHTVMENNVTCIVIQFAAQLNVSYTKNNSSIIDHKCLNVPANASVINSSCSAKNGTEQWFTLGWSEESYPASMTLVFLKNGTNYNLKSLNVTLPAAIFPNATLKNPVELYHGAAWQTPLATSYRCNPVTVLNLSSDGPAGNLTLSKLQEEAFRTSAGTTFSAARDCGSGDVPDAVPIAVGCALGGLVIVVLVAYLVGRRRSASRGYLSM